MERQITEMHSVLRGNGQPGLIKEMEQIKGEVRKDREQTRLHSKVLWAVFLSILSLLVAGIKVHYSQSDPVMFLPVPSTQAVR